MCTCLHVTRGCLVQSLVSAFDVSLPSRKDTRFLVPRAAVRARPLQHLEVAAPRRVCARTSPRPKENSPLEMSSTPRAVRPLLAAAAQTSVRSQSLRRPRECLSFSKLTYPSPAASSFETFLTSRPVASTASRMPRLTARSRPRSAGSGKLVGPRIPFFTSRGSLSNVVTPASGSRAPVMPASEGMSRMREACAAEVRRGGVRGEVTCCRGRRGKGCSGVFLD